MNGKNSLDRAGMNSYLDDTYLVHGYSSDKDMKDSLNHTISSIDALVLQFGANNFGIDSKKAQLQARHQATFLGFKLDTAINRAEQQAQLSPERVD